ncbi:unnamed protein product [Alternaria alternata]
MRLLRHDDGGRFSLVEYVGRDSPPPPYATLSHTWGADHEEVTFKDLTEGTGKSKVGYLKLSFCAKQAARDNLQFFWVDTCCIDKSNSVELSEAINSMFRWYHNSAKCYVYLSDVATTGSANIHESFQKSKWFTRGWTLQELLAPPCVEFFSKEGNRLGDKNSLVTQIAAITSISARALQGAALSDIIVEERMSWARGRVTKREEDIAYCQLGIFDIYMPLIYGEGERNALERLRKKIAKASKDEWALQTLISAAKTVDVELNGELGGNDAGELSWASIVRRWKNDGRCFNCGGKHQEYSCGKECGKCTSYSSS